MPAPGERWGAKASREFESRSHRQMANIIERLGYPDIFRLHDLADNLDGALSVIAYGNGAEDVEAILKRQKEIAQEYKDFIESLPKLTGGDCGLSQAIESVVMAYNEFQSLIEEGVELDVDTIREKAEEALQGNLFFFKEDDF